MPLQCAQGAQCILCARLRDERDVQKNEKLGRVRWRRKVWGRDVTHAGYSPRLVSTSGCGPARLATAKGVPLGVARFVSFLFRPRVPSAPGVDSLDFESLSWLS